jgi:hypothetical protein
MAQMPKELFEEVWEVALAIVNAGSVGEEAVAESAYQRLRELYDVGVAKGEVYAHLTEIVADFTVDDNAERVRLFKEAIAQAAGDPEEPLYTKMFSLAETLLEVGRVEEAEAYLVSARADAEARGDGEAARESEKLLGKCWE